MEGLDRSQADEEIRTVTDCPGDDSKNKRSVRTKTRAGNPAWLTRAQAALDATAKLLKEMGLDHIVLDQLVRKTLLFCEQKKPDFVGIEAEQFQELLVHEPGLWQATIDCYRVSFPIVRPAYGPPSSRNIA